VDSDVEESDEDEDSDGEDSDEVNEYAEIVEGIPTHAMRPGLACRHHESRGCKKRELGLLRL
jgi:hypothetical protein